MSESAYRHRLDAALAAGVSGIALDDILTEGYARALRLDADGLALRRRATELAADAGAAGRARELRRLWLTHATLARELADLRTVLRRAAASRELAAG